MRVKVLVADDDMDAHQLLYDVIELNFRDAQIERALSPQTFWAKIDAAKESDFWQYIFISIDYITEEPHDFLRRLRECDLFAKCKIIVVGTQEDFDAQDEEIKKLPFLSKPFSLDTFESVTSASVNA